MRMANLFRSSALVALNVENETGGAVIIVPPAEPEATAEAAVEIARIEGETAIRLAEIDQAGDVARIEAHAEADQAFAETLAENINDGLEAEKTEWQIRAETAEAELAALKSSTPPHSQEQAPPSPPHGEEEAALRVVEPSPEPAAESPPSPPPEPPKRRPAARWI